MRPERIANSSTPGNIRVNPETEPKVKTSVETMAYYNMILTDAIFQLLEEKGLLRRQEATPPIHHTGQLSRIWPLLNHLEA
jgi:hypothetical protein